MPNLACRWLLSQLSEDVYEPIVMLGAMNNEDNKNAEAYPLMDQKPGNQRISCDYVDHRSNNVNYEHARDLHGYLIFLTMSTRQTVKSTGVSIHRLRLESLGLL